MGNAFFQKLLYLCFSHFKVIKIRYIIYIYMARGGEYIESTFVLKFVRHVGM